jgi:hypothetical protein
MNFLAFSPLLAYSFLATIALLIVLLHLLRPRALRRVISSTVLWGEVIKAHRKHHAPWRWLLSLLLCLLIGLALALALTRPQGIGRAQSRVVVLLDNSPSMAARTRDGQTRWAHALDRARELMASTRADVMLADTMGRAPISGFVRPAQAIAALDELSQVSYGPVRLPQLPPRNEIEVHVISDGVADYALPADARVHSVFESADNVAVTGLQTRAFATDPLRVEAFVQVYNASSIPKRVRLSLRGGDRFSVAQDLQMGAGELIDASFDITDFSEGVLAAAALSRDDAYPLDDIAYAIVAAHRVRNILLVSDGNTRLEDSIRSLPGVRMTTVRPAAFDEAMSADAYVFDSFAPSRAPKRGSLLFRPPPVSWLPGDRRDVREPVVSDWKQGHPLLDGFAWSNLRVERASLVTDASGGQIDALVRTTQGALIATGSEHARWIVAGFVPQGSNLPLQPGFPIFLGNALNWLTETEPVVSSTLGTIRIPLINAQVIDGKGEPVASRDIPGATIFDAAQPDVYTARANGQIVRVVANVLDPRDSDINLSRFGSESTAGLRVSASSRIEPWFALVAIALIVLMIEWMAYLRRFAT